MMLFIIRTDSLKNLQSIFFPRFFHHNRLEATLQCRIFFNVFTIFFYRSRTDQLNLTSGKRWLENIGSIHCSLSPTGTDDRM